MKRYQQYIDGKWQPSASGKHFSVLDPSKREPIAEAADGNAEDIDRAVQAARRAFDEGPWRETSAQERGRVLFRAARWVEENSARLAELETRNNGKPLAEAEGDTTVWPPLFGPGTSTGRCGRSKSFGPASSG